MKIILILKKYYSKIFRTYWATEEEKREFSEEDFKRILETETRKKENYIGKNVDEIFEKRKRASENTEKNSLIVVKKEGFIKKMFKRILEFIKK